MNQDKASKQMAALRQEIQKLSLELTEYKQVHYMYRCMHGSQAKTIKLRARNCYVVISHKLSCIEIKRE